jgi:hypothetical protein
MKKWLRRSLIAATLIGLTFGVLYEMSTHAAATDLREQGPRLVRVGAGE